MKTQNRPLTFVIAVAFLTITLVMTCTYRLEKLKERQILARIMTATEEHRSPILFIGTPNKDLPCKNLPRKMTSWLPEGREPIMVCTLILPGIEKMRSQRRVSIET